MSEGRENELSIDDFEGFSTYGWMKLDFLACVSSLALARLEKRHPLPFEERLNKIDVHDHVVEESGGSKESLAMIKERNSNQEEDCLADKKVENARKSKARPVTGRPGAIDLRFGPDGGLPLDLQERIEGMGGTQILLVCQKELKASHVNKNQHRLLMPESIIRNSFLREDELAFLKTRVGTKLNKIPVVVVEPSMETVVLSLKRWSMRKEELVLAGGWNEAFLKRNGLKAGDVVQVWSFRVGVDLRLALVVARN